MVSRNRAPFLVPVATSGMRGARWAVRARIARVARARAREANCARRMRAMRTGPVFDEQHASAEGIAFSALPCCRLLGRFQGSAGNSDGARRTSANPSPRVLPSTVADHVCRRLGSVVLSILGGARYPAREGRHAGVVFPGPGSGPLRVGAGAGVGLVARLDMLSQAPCPRSKAASGTVESLCIFLLSLAHHDTKRLFGSELRSNASKN